MVQGSNIFLRNRVIGYVSNHVPLVTKYIKRRKEHFVVTSVGRCFHTYGSEHFSLVTVSGQHSTEITCMAADAFFTYTAAGSVIYAWRRGTEINHTYEGHKKPVHLLLPFGTHLISVDEDSVVKVWNIEAEEVHLEIPFSNDSFEISAVVHPHTYLNKILFGCKQGTMQLWNINTSKLIYTFKGWDAKITILEQAPAVDIIAVGLASGKIVLHNLKFDESLVVFTQDWGSVTNIAFRTDGQPVMISGTLRGHLVFWDLQEKKLMNQILSAHESAVTGMECLPDEPLLVTSSPDNSLKMWIFDKPDGGARLLRFRGGHSHPPTFIRHYGTNGHNILSAGGDATLRIFSTRNETFNKSLGKASYNRKATKKKRNTDFDPHIMPPIVSFAAESTREKDWDNIAAIHDGQLSVTTWSYDKLKMGDRHIKPDNFVGRSTHATSLCVTSCGNFVIVGYSSGHLKRYNIQSLICRESYGDPKAHEGAIRGVACDSLNQFVVSGSEATLKFWTFCNKGKRLEDLELPECVHFFHQHRESSLLAVALEALSVLIVDLDTRTIIRHLTGHAGQITDVAFSPDGRWLVTASMDCTIRTWNIPSAHLIDIFKVDAPCTSLSFSPVGDLLATSHVNTLGICLWANMTLFRHVSLHPVKDMSDIPFVSLASFTGESFVEGGVEDADSIEYKSPEQISEDLVTLSSLASSRWQNLLNIDIIKQRNKPKEPLKKPKSAPFFLPTIPSVELQFDLSKDMDKNVEEGMSANLLQRFTVFGKMLLETKESGEFCPVVEKLKQMGPSAVNFEILSLAPEGEGSYTLMLQFLKLIEWMLISNKDFELAQSYLGLFLKTHGDVVTSVPLLRDYLDTMETCQMTGWQKMEDKLLYSLCVIESLKLT